MRIWQPGSYTEFMNEWIHRRMNRSKKKYEKQFYIVSYWNTEGPGSLVHFEKHTFILKRQDLLDMLCIVTLHKILTDWMLDRLHLDARGAGLQLNQDCPKIIYKKNKLFRLNIIRQFFIHKKWRWVTFGEFCLYQDLLRFTEEHIRSFIRNLK